MASPSRDQIVAKFRARQYPDCPQSVAEELLQDSWVWACQMLRLRTSTITVNLTANQRYYDFAGTNQIITDGYYCPSAEMSTWNQMSGELIDVIRRVEEGWLANNSTGNTWRYMLTSAESGVTGKRSLVVDPLPFESTSGGYPILTFYCITSSTLSGSTQIPDYLPTDVWFRYDMAYRWAVEQDPGRADEWFKLRQREGGEFARYLQAGVDDTPPQVFLSPFVTETSQSI